MARALGAPDDVAEAAVAAITAKDDLADGILFVAAVGAARWGVEIPDAVSLLAGGTKRYPASPSDYEARVAADEGTDHWDDLPAVSLPDDDTIAASPRNLTARTT